MMYRAWGELKQKLIAIICLSAAFNAMLPNMLQNIEQSDWFSATIHGFGQSYVIWICLFLVLKLSIIKQENECNISVLSSALLATLSIALLIPIATLSWLVCAGMCLVWRSIKSTNDSTEIASSILFAIAVRDPICQSFLNLFSEQILNFDAWISGLMLVMTDNPAIVEGNTIVQPSGHTLLILTGCSVFTNLSLAFLLWISVTLYLHRVFILPDTLRALTLILCIILMNAGRLALMAIDIHWYEFLHSDYSQELIQVLTILISLLCIRRNTTYAVNQAK